MKACRHRFKPCPIEGYERCGCGTYHSLVAPAPESIYSSNYWTEAAGHSTIRDQVHNVDVHLERGVSKNRSVLNQIIFPLVRTRSYARDSGPTAGTAALEIGCAPGKLLASLYQMVPTVVGIETDPAYETDIREIAGVPLDLMFGYFPEVTADLKAESFGLILGLDVFEHSPAPESFLKECARLLPPWGQLILMLPLVIPGQDLPERMFHKTEHVYLHGMDNMAAMLWDAGFCDVRFESPWCSGHEIVTARRTR